MNLRRLLLCFRQRIHKGRELLTQASSDTQVELEEEAVGMGNPWRYTANRIILVIMTITMMVIITK